MCADERFDRLRRLPPDALDDVGLSTEDAVLVILGDGGKVMSSRSLTKMCEN